MIPWGVFISLSVICLLGKVNAAVILGTSLSVSEVYNDNVFFDDSQAGVQGAEFITTISPVLNIAYSSKNFTLRVVSGGGLEFHSENSGEDGFFPTFTTDLDFPGLTRKFKGVTLKFRENIRYVPQLQAFSFSGEQRAVEGEPDRTLQGGEGVQSERINTLQNRAEIFLSVLLSDRLSLSASYVNIISQFSGGDREDTVVHNGDIVGTYHYASSRKTDWNASYGAFVTSSESEVDFFHNLNLGMLHRLERHLSMSGNIGISFIEGVSPRMTLEAGISKELKNRHFSLKYDRGVERGEGVIERVFTRESILGAMNWRLGKKTSLFLNVGYAKNNSVQGNVNVDVTTNSISGGMSRSFLTWLHGSLNYSHLNQDSTGDLGNDGEVNVVSISLTAIGPRWRAIK